MDYPYTREGDKIHFPGIQMRNENTRDGWVIIAENKAESLVVVRLPPGSCWSGQGRPWRYTPAEIRVFKLNPKRGTAEIVLEIPISKKGA